MNRPAKNNISIDELQKNLALLIINTEEPFVLIDRHLNIITYNDQFKNQYYDYFSIELVKGSSILNYAQANRVNELKTIYNEVFKGEVIESEIEIPRLDNKTLIFLNKYKPALDETGKIIGAFISSVNITEKKRWQKLQQFTENRFKSLIENSYEIISLTDKDGDVIYISPAIERITGFKPNELIDKTCFLRMHPDQVKESKHIVEYVLQNPGIAVPRINRFLHKNGSYVWVEGTVTNLLNDLSVNAIVSNYRDITTKLLIEEELLKNYALLKNLNENLERRTEELIRLNSELEQFAYIASHDLQEPLRMITGFLNLLELKYKEQLDDKAKQYIHFATDGALRMRRIILDLLEYSMAGKKTHETESVNINELLYDAVQLNRKVIEEKNALIEWNDLSTINGNKSSLQQVFQNLISNALKYQKNNVSPVITIKTEETDTHWKFSFSDNGIGIDPRFFDKIFVVFQRLHNKDEYSGTGLGLAICKKIVENHGGKIWVESTLEKGSTFYFTIIK